MKLEHAQLLVDRYLRNVAPDSQTLGKSFGLEVMATLASQLRGVLNAKNQGVTSVRTGPREGLTQALRTLGERLARRSEHPDTPKSSWLNRLRGSK